MASPHNSKRTRRLDSTAVRRRRRVVGWGTSASAIAAFGLSPLVSVPAHADGLDVIFDPIINSIDHTLTGIDALTGLDLGANLDLSDLGGGALGGAGGVSRWSRWITHR
jgi:hypothetical protein